MDKRFFIAWIAVFIVWMAGSFVVHGVLLHDDYMKVQSLFRPEAEAHAYFPYMILAHVLISGALVWIYSRGVEPGPWIPQGLRFGIAVALLTVVPTYLVYYVVQPMPGMLVAKQIIFDSIVTLIVSEVVAFLYRDRTAA